MANINKKIINRWDGGIKTSARDSSRDTSDGAIMVKHFDIFTDPKKLIPMPGWTSFTTDTEKKFNIKGLGGFDSTVYGIGKGLANWYGHSWNYRIKVTVNESLFTATGMPTWFNLALMPSNFWSHVNDDGSDIRVTNKDGGTAIEFSVENFDKDAQTGDLWINALDITTPGGDYFYVYYGDASAEFISSGTSTSRIENSPASVWNTSNLRFAYTFASNVDNQYKINEGEEFTSEPEYVNGSFGKAIRTRNTTIQTNSDAEVDISASDVSISFMIYLDALPTGSSTIIEDHGYWNININSTGKLEVLFTATSGNTLCTSTASLSVGQWYVIDVVFNDDQYQYINGVKQTFDINDGNFDGDIVDAVLKVRTIRASTGLNFCRIAQVWGFNNDITDAQIATKYANFTNGSFWSVSTEESKSNTALQYDGVAMYKKEIDGTEWIDYLIQNQPVKLSSKYAINSFLEQIGNDWYFANSSNDNYGGIITVSKTNSITAEVDGQHLILNTASGNFSVSTSASPVDNSVYITSFSQFLAELGDPGSENAYEASSSIRSITPWRNYLAIGVTRRNRGYIEIWDLAQTNPIERADMGTGNLRIVGNASDVLFGVTDNFVDDEIKSSGQPTIEIRRYIGNGQMQTTHVIEVPSIYNGWVEDWERAVSNFQIRRNTETLFYAKVPKNTTATEFNEGYWAIGKNDRDNLALTLMIDTAELGNPENIFGFAKQVFFIQKDGGIQRLSTDGSYNKTSLYTTLRMNEGNTEIEKKLHGIEIVTEPLEENQVVSVYYRINGGSDRTKICDFYGSGEISYEAIYDINSINLPNYKEIEFDIESTKGKSAILEFNYRYEYLSDIV